MGSYSVRDKVVFVTGAGRGLGANTARMLTHRGARVIIADIDSTAAQQVVGRLPEGSALHLPWAT